MDFTSTAIVRCSCSSEQHLQHTAVFSARRDAVQTSVTTPSVYPRFAITSLSSSVQMFRADSLLENATIPNTFEAVRRGLPPLRALCAADEVTDRSTLRSNHASNPCSAAQASWGRFGGNRSIIYLRNSPSVGMWTPGCPPRWNCLS